MLAVSSIENVLSVSVDERRQQEDVSRLGTERREKELEVVLLILS